MAAIIPKTRFAPSPNGELHLGHAYSALFSRHIAEMINGQFIVRIEDIDLARCTDLFRLQIFDDLTWLGLAWPEPVLRQSTRFDAYADALDKLKSQGLLYPCFCTRKDIRETATAQTARDPDGGLIYSGTCKKLSRSCAQARQAQGLPFSLRLNMSKALSQVPGRLTFHEYGTGHGPEPSLVNADPAIWGDVILARKDIGTSYHLAVVLDDALQGITNVTRGQDLFYATHLHRLLQMLLGLPEPAYHHHRLLRAVDGEKLSKSAKHPSLQSLRHAGLSPQQVVQMTGLP